MYIHGSICISPQRTFPETNLDELVLSSDNKLQVIEPNYEEIPANVLRRMGKAVRMGVGTALALLKRFPDVNGIVIGTANGGMEESIKFLNQIIQYEEGTLTPTNFVQSTTNAIAAQIGLTARNRQYNITHVHRGLAFEHALLDAIMLLAENPGHTYLLGGVDEISAYNFNIEYLNGAYKKNEIISNDLLFESRTPGSIAGEGVAMFIVNNEPTNATSSIKALKTLHSTDAGEVMGQLNVLLEDNLAGRQGPTLFLTGENGDSRLSHFYAAAETILDNVPTARFKHLCGEYPTASSFAVWLADHILSQQTLPAHLLKNDAPLDVIDSVLIYNTYKGRQHSFILLERSFLPHSPH